MSELVRYSEMCRAIQAAYAVDEVKDLRDKAMALEHYQRQAKNFEAERQACEIRLRAERRCGELLKQMEKAKPRGSNQHVDMSRDSTHPKTLSELGISRDESSRWQKLADIPEAEFEAALAAEEQPTTTGLLRMAEKPKQDPVDPQALWLWGRLRDFERDGLLSISANELLGTMTETMIDDCLRLAPVVATWLEELSNARRERPIRDHVGNLRKA